MRVVPSAKITSVVEKMCVDMNLRLPADVVSALRRAFRAQKNRRARSTLGVILENAAAAPLAGAPLCQDTGAVEAYIETGEGVSVSGGSLAAAVEKGVRRAYLKNGFRLSIAADPFERVNTGDNAPVSFYFSRKPGDKIGITLAAKGGGSENASALKFFPPSAGWKTVERFIVDTVREKAPYACPPVIVGVAAGGNFSTAPAAAKKTFLRRVGSVNPSEIYARRERALLKKINSLGVGPAATGGSTTALAVFIEPLPTHIASLACAVAVGCHSLRRVSAVV